MPSLGEKALQTMKVPYTPHEYDYRKKGVEAAAEALQIELSATIKSLVLKLSDGNYVFFLVPGGRTASMRNFARALKVKQADLAPQRDTERLTGYQVGGIGPFGTRTPLPVYADLHILDHDVVYINGGRRGLLLAMDPEALLEAAHAELVDAT